MYIGKTNLYVVDQNNIDTLDADQLTALETECKRRRLYGSKELAIRFANMT